MAAEDSDTCFMSQNLRSSNGSVRPQGVASPSASVSSLLCVMCVCVCVCVYSCNTPHPINAHVHPHTRLHVTSACLRVHMQNVRVFVLAPAGVEPPGGRMPSFRMPSFLTSRSDG